MSEKEPSNNHLVKAVISLSFPPAAAVAAAGCWWHIWPIIGGSGEDDVSWKLVHTWRVSRQPGATWWRAVGEKNLSIAELSSPLFSSFLIRRSVANQRLLFSWSILPLNFLLLLHRQSKGYKGRCNIQFINHAVKKCQGCNCGFLTPFKGRQILLVG